MSGVDGSPNEENKVWDVARDRVPYFTLHFSHFLSASGLESAL